MLLLKNFIGRFPLKYGIYVSVLWHFFVMLIMVILFQVEYFAIVEIWVVIMMMLSFCICPNGSSHYVTWMVNKFVMAAFFGIVMVLILISQSFSTILIYIPIFSILFSLEIYFGMITFSIYYDMKHLSGIVASPPKTSKGPGNANALIPEVIVSSGASDIGSNLLFDLPIDGGCLPSCPSSSTYFYVPPACQRETADCDSVQHQFLHPYQVQPAFNPKFQPPTSFS